MSSEDWPAVYHGPARNEYQRADGKVVHLGQPIEPQSSEVILYVDLRFTPLDGVMCPVCGSVITLSHGSPAIHSAWHRELKRRSDAVNRLLGLA